MKLNRSYYCIVDKNNKPDFRYLFETEGDAKRKIKQIKNSTKGETLFVKEGQRDFFFDSVRKNFISPQRKISIKRGCWTGLHVEKIKLLENIAPEKVFKRLVKCEENQLCYSKQRDREATFHNPTVKMPVVPNPLATFDWANSLLKTRSFMVGLSLLCFITVMSVFFIQRNTTDKITQQLINEQSVALQKTAKVQTQVLGKKDEKMAQQFDEELDSFVLDSLKKFESIRQEDLANEITNIVAGSPMERMAPEIAKQDRTVAAFLVGIAKKESNLGRRVPVLNGQDCFNYWGYRGIRDRMGTGGHTCFDSPEDAVNTVAKRLQDLVQADVDTPQEMVIWKCGSSCAGHSPGSVKKWISDVNMYFSELEG